MGRRRAGAGGGEGSSESESAASQRPQSRPAPTPITFTPHRPAPSHSGHTTGVPVLPYFIPSASLPSWSTVPTAPTCLPMGTSGFSRVLRINFSLKLSEVLYTLGLKPSMTGGCDGSKGASGVTRPGVSMFRATAVGENSDAKPRLLMRSLKGAGKRALLNVVRRRGR